MAYPEVKEEPVAEFFKVRSPLLKKGRLDTHLARTKTMRVWIKCYAEGGENAMHAHPIEDHTFVVLQGKATFYDKDGDTRALGRNDGILIPAGAFYRFHSSADEPLVMMRIGAYIEHDSAKPARINIEGKPLRGDSKENLVFEKPEAIPGAFYE